MKPHWRTNLPNYRQLHRWVENTLGKPNRCNICGDTSKRRYEWANISNQYLKDVSDWQRLCVPCHRRLTRNTHNMCSKGHKLTPENTYIRKNTNYKNCKKCRATYRLNYLNKEN